MLTDNQKKKFVEYGIGEFASRPEFLVWLISEFDEVYDHKMKSKCKECKTKGGIK